MKDKIENLLIDLRAHIFYIKNKRTGVTKDFIEYLYYRLPNTQNILNLIKSSKNKEELKRKAKENFDLISKDLCLTNFIDGLLFETYDISATYYIDAKALKIILDNDYSLDDIKHLLKEYKDLIFQYIVSTNKVKNSIERGTINCNDFTKSVTPELLDSIISKLDENPATLTPEDAKNNEVLRKIITKLLTLYPKEVIEDKKFIEHELLTGLTDKYFSQIGQEKYQGPVPTLEERIKKYQQANSLTPEQSLQLQNIELLEQRINKINHQNKEELLDLIAQIKQEQDIAKKLELIEECYSLYEITFRQEIVDSLFTPTSSMEITDINQLQYCLIHKFIPRSGDLLKGYDIKLKQKIIQESSDQDPNRELTQEEQERFQRLMDYAENVLANKLVVEETIENDLTYTDRNGFRRYKSDTSNQISTSLLQMNEESLNALVGFIGIGFDETTLSPENIAISSPSYKTTNMGVDNLEIPIEYEFQELSAPLSELEQANRGESEVVLFRKGVETFTKAAYVFVGVRTTTEPKDIAKIEEAKKLAEENNLKLIVFNVGKILKSMKNLEQDIEPNVSMSK